MFLDIAFSIASLSALLSAIAAIIAVWFRFKKKPEEKYYNKFHINNDERQDDFCTISSQHDQLTYIAREIALDVISLPSPTTQQLVGRTKELAELTQAFKNPSIGVMVWVASGGTGKSSLIWHWLREQKKYDFDEINHIFGFSFYSQGHHKTYTDSNTFFSRVLPFLGVDSIPTDEIEKGRTLARCLVERATLLILDGLEPLQLNTGKYDGSLQDTALRSFFNTFRVQRHRCSFVLVSSRQKLKELEQWDNTAYIQRDLNNLHSSDGMALLRLKGVKGTDAELQEVVENVDSHALSIVLLSNLFVNHYGGIIPSEWKSHFWHGEANILEVSEDTQHSIRILSWYEQMLNEQELLFLYLLSLFDCPMRLSEKELLVQALDFFIPLRELNASPKQWRVLENHLESLGLLASTEFITETRRTNWDTHALIRSFFSQHFATHYPTEFKNSHRILFYYYQEKAPNLPDSIDDMQPLYRAVVHGCLAEEFQRALDLYAKRILRGSESFSIKKLGAWAQDLRILAAFFPTGWQQPPVDLSDIEQAGLLAQAAFCLISLGRLRDALEPVEASLDIFIKVESWNNASSVAQNLTDLYLPLGELSQAEQIARQSVKFAEQSNNKWEQLKSHAYLATVLHRQGRMAEATILFSRAEEIQREQQPDYPHLYSIWGAWYCAFLFDEATINDKADNSVRLSKFSEVLQRSEYGLKIAQEHVWINELAHYLLVIARIKANLKQDRQEQLKTNFHQAIKAIETAKKVEFFPPFYLTRAEFLMGNGALEQARQDIDYAREIINRSDMMLYAVDADLLEARYWELKNDVAHATNFWELAEMGIARTGYGLRRLVMPN